MMFVACPVTRRLRGLLHRREASRSVIFRQSEQERRDGDADQRAQVQVCPAGRVHEVADDPEGDVAHQPVGDRRECRGRDHARDDQPLQQRALDVVGFRAHRERADDRGDDRHAADHQRVEHDARGLVEGEHAEQHHGDRGDRVGLEQVGRHAGAVADVVADVVGDRRGVARIVLGDAGLDLADEVGADIGGLREDAAAEPREHRDQRAAEAEPDQRVNGRLGAVVEERGQRAVVAGDADQREPDHEQPGDRPAAEGDAQRRRDPAAGGLGHARVGAHRDVHADVAGRAREDAADREAAGDGDVLDEDQRDEQHHPDDARSSCTGGSDRRGRPAARPARCPASSRCPARARAGIAWSPGRRSRRRRRIQGRRRPHGSSESCSTVNPPRSDWRAARGSRAHFSPEHAPVIQTSTPSGVNARAVYRAGLRKACRHGEATAGATTLAPVPPP